MNWNIIKILLLFLFLKIPLYISAQDKHKIDSLKSVAFKNPADSNNVIALNQLCWELARSVPDSALYFGKMAQDFAKEKGIKKWQSRALINQGIVCYFQSKFKEALTFYSNALVIAKETKNTGLILKCFNNIGLVYSEQGDYPKALDNYFKALKVAEEAKNDNVAAALLGNIGIIFHEQKKLDKALEYYTLAWKKFEALKDERGIPNNLANIGVAYKEIGNTAKAIDYDNKALTLYTKLGDKNGSARCLNNLGQVYEEMKDYEPALSFYESSLKFRKEINDKTGICTNLENIASIKQKQAKFKESIPVLEQALLIALEIENIKEQRYIYEGLANGNSKLGNFEKAFNYHVKFKALNDSVFTTESSQQLADMGIKYESEKKEQAIQLLNRDNALQSLELKQKANQRKAFIIGIVLLLILVLFIFRGYTIKKRSNMLLTDKNIRIEKQNVEIRHQKELVEEKQKEILDSIHYAKRIQTALMPTEKYIQRNLNKARNSD